MKIVWKIAFLECALVWLALIPTGAWAWQATRFSNHGTLTDIWIIQCNDGYQTAQVGEPDFGYQGCKNHGGLVVPIPPIPDGTLSEFEVAVLDVLPAPPPPSQFTVASLINAALLTADQAFSLTNSAEPFVWADTLVQLSLVPDPSSFTGIGIFGVNQNILETTSVSEPGTLALLALGLVGLFGLRREGRKGHAQLMQGTVP